MLKKDKNVLFIVRTMSLGGTENVVLQLCEILSDEVNKIVVCSSGGVHEEILKKMGIKHYTVPDIASKNLRDMAKIFSTIKRIIKDAKTFSSVKSNAINKKRISENCASN